MEWGKLAGRLESCREGFFLSDKGCAVVFAVVSIAGFLAAHVKTPGMPFLSDDFMLATIFNPPSLYKLFRFSIPEACGFIYFRPLAFLSFSLDSLVWGTNPLGFHITNLLLHGGDAVLIYLLGLRLTGSRAGAAAASGLFLVFPLQLEVTVWIAGRFGSLALFFYLLCALAYVRFRQSGDRRFFLVSVLCGMLSVLAKESGLSFPLLLLALELIVFREVPALRKKGLLLCLMLLVLVIPLFLAFRWSFQGGVGEAYLESMQSEAPGTSLVQMVPMLALNVLQNIWFHALLPLAVPFYKLSAWPLSTTWAYWALVLLLLLPVGVTTGTLWSRGTVFSLCGFLFSLVPVALVLHAVSYVTLENARVLYIPAMFLCLLLGNLAFGSGKTKRPSLRRAVGFVPVLALIVILSVGLAHNYSPWRVAGLVTSRIQEQFLSYAQQTGRPAHVFVEDMPHNMNGVFLFNSGFIGFSEAANLAAGTMPPFVVQPGEKKLASYMDFLYSAVPWKIVTPGMFEREVLLAELECQGFTFPEWVSPDKEDYDHILRWNPHTFVFEVVK